MSRKMKTNVKATSAQNPAAENALPPRSKFASPRVHSIVQIAASVIQGVFPSPETIKMVLKNSSRLIPTPAAQAIAWRVAEKVLESSGSSIDRCFTVELNAAAEAVLAWHSILHASAPAICGATSLAPLSVGIGCLLIERVEQLDCDLSLPNRTRSRQLHKDLANIEG
jgi:hypothetical protein